MHPYNRSLLPKPELEEPSGLFVDLETRSSSILSNNFLSGFRNII